MKTIANGIILKGLDLTPSRENILIDDGEIIEISKDVMEGEIIDAENKIVAPKFLNAHTHIGDTIIKDEGDGLSIGEIVRPPNGIKHLALEAASDETLRSAMKESMWQMHDLGISHFMDYREGGLHGVKLLRKASEDIPIKPIILGRDGSFYGEDPNMHEVKVAVRKLLKHADGIGLSGFGRERYHPSMLLKAKGCSLIQWRNVARQNLKELMRQASTRLSIWQILRMMILKILLSQTALLPSVHVQTELPLIGTDNIMLNSPNMFRELEFTLKIMKAYSRSYISPKDILKLATTNACHEDVNIPGLDKSYIEVGQKEELFIANCKSNNPILSLINRTEIDDIVYISK